MLSNASDPSTRASDEFTSASDQFMSRYLIYSDWKHQAQRCAGSAGESYREAIRKLSGSYPNSDSKQTFSNLVPGWVGFVAQYPGLFLTIMGTDADAETASEKIVYDTFA